MAGFILFILRILQSCQTCVEKLLESNRSLLDFESHLFDLQKMLLEFGASCLHFRRYQSGSEKTHIESRRIEIAVRGFMTLLSKFKMLFARFMTYLRLCVRFRLEYEPLARKLVLLIHD